MCLANSSDSVDQHPSFFGGVMSPRKQHVDRFPIIPDQASVIPRPLLELYNRASLFLDKQSAVYDHYWAVGIHKAIHASFPECGETHTTARTKKQKPTIGPCCQVSPQIARTRRKREQRIDNKAAREQRKRRCKSGPPTSQK